MKRLVFLAYSVLLFLVLADTCVLAQGNYTCLCNSSDYAVINGPTHTAVDGDVINIPAGTCTWSQGIPVSVGISIIGAGAGLTVIQESFNGTLFTINIPSATSSLSRVSGMTFRPTTGAASGTPAIANITRKSAQAPAPTFAGMTIR